MGAVDGVLQSVSYGGFKSFYTPKNASKYYGGKIYGNVSVAILSTIYTMEASAGAVITSPTGVGAVAFSAAAAYTASIAVSASACAAKNTIMYSTSKDGSNNNRKFNTSKQTSKVWKNLKNYKGVTKSSGAGRSKQYYEWDNTHNDIEVYNNRGECIGSMDPNTGKMYKPAVRGRKIKI